MRHLRLILGLAALMLVTITAQAAKGDIFTIDNLTYTVLAAENATTLTGTVSVKSANTTISGTLNIPQTVENNGYTYTVTTIVSKGFQNCTSLSTVTLPSSIKTINTYAFDGCTGLRSINIPDGIKSIPNYAFRNCKQLGSITIPNSVTAIGSYTFYYCEKMTKVVMSDNVVKIPNTCFACCRRLSSINLQKVKTIGKEAFLSCSSLTELSLDSLISLSGVWVFQNCTSLRKVKLGEGVTSIPQQCFDGCTMLEDINLQNIVSIGNSAFNKCMRLKVLTWSNKLKSIASSAFAGCTSLVNVEIPNSVDTLGYTGTFTRCSNIETITLPNNIRTIPAAFVDCSNNGYSKIENIDIPTSVKKIENWCFAGSNIRVLKIPNSVESIGYCNLISCNSIHTTLPSFLKQCDWGVYSGVGSRFGANRAPTELTFPAYIKSMTYSYQGQQAKYIYVMGDTILKYMARKEYKPSDPSVIYVKKSVFFDKFSNGEWDGLTVDYKIPVSMTNTSGNPIEYKTLCRDFDVDLTHTNDNLPEGVEPLRAYLVEDVDGDLRMVFLNEIKYIPSRLKANTTDSEGNRYQGVDEYVGVVLRGTPGYTYYYEMGEHDYTQGAEGQWLLDDAMEYSGSTYEGNLMAGDANDEFYVYKTVEDANNNEIINYGLNSNRFKIYHKDGWLMYNKAYLQLPKYVSDAIEADTDAEGNANLTFMFQNADGSTDKVSSIEFNQNSESDIFYNPYGQRVNANTKGIVINSGKKYVNK